MRWVLGALDVGQDFRKYKNNNNNNKRKSARANFSEQRNKHRVHMFCLKLPWKYIILISKISWDTAMRTSRMVHNHQWSPPPQLLSKNNI
jgi:hypothetical protein